MPRRIYMGFREDKWWVAPANYMPEVTSKLQFVKDVKILDTTLRDGEQQPGVVFSREDKVAIAKKLDAIGIHKIEAGTPAVSQGDADAIREICDSGLKAEIYCFVRNVVSDIELAKKCGVYGVLAEVPGSEHLLNKGMKWGVEKAIKAACEATSAARDLGMKVTFFPADGSRASLDFLLDTLSAIKEGGHLDAVTLVDTFGAFSPEGAAYTVRKMIERLQCPIEVHCHEDFGLSVATTIAALSAGASCAHVTVNGIGERTGNTPLEPLLVSLRALYGIDTGIDLSRLLDLSREVEKRSGSPVSPLKAVVGERIFGWETGMPVGMWKNCKDSDPLVMLPYLWPLVSQRAPYIYTGKKSGAANIALVAEELGISLSEEEIKTMVTLVKDRAISVKRDLSRQEFKELADTLKK
jgi:isopropylmalate/homocitrate/citramalate synthase